MRAFLLVLLICFCLPCFSQTKIIEGKKINSNYPVLKEHFKSWETFEISSADLQSQIHNQTDNIQVSLKLGNQHHWNLLLHDSDLRSDAYRFQTAEGKFSFDRKNKAFAGYELSTAGQSVRLTVDDNFIYGYVEKDNERWFVEPLHYFVKNAAADTYVIYAEKNVIPKEGDQCGVTEMNNKTKQLHNDYHDAPEVVGQCYEVELAIASDFSMFQKYGSINAVENHNIGVMNNVQGNYDNEFADEIIFQIVTQFVSNCATCDGWSATTDASNLLSSFRAWGNSGGFGVSFDVGQLWTDRNLDGSTVGIAYVGAICTNSRYHVLQDYTSNASSLRVVTAHELGHNFDSGHDTTTGFIMSPSVNNTSTWSNSSINVINAFVTQLANGGCFSTCTAAVAPVAAFDVNVQSICAGNTVQFFDQSQNNPNSWVWQFPGGNPAVSTEKHPLVTYNVAGTYNVTLTASNAVGSNTVAQNGIITVGNNGTSILLWESFEGGLTNWGIANPDNSNTWGVSNVGGAQLGNNAAYMDNWSYNNGVGQRDAIISMPMDFSGYNNINLEMDYGYALWSGATSSNDSLIIYASINGGGTFTRLYQNAENGSGNFATTQPIAGEFIPGGFTSWCYAGSFGANCLSLDLSSFAGQSNVVLMIENYSKFGNNMFVDNISITSACQILLPPVAAFTSTTPTGCTPLTVQFTDQSQNSPAFWSWQFSGGSPSTSNEQNPIVTYTSGGSYDVILTITNGAGNDSQIQTSYVVVDETPVASFTFSNNANTYTFNNASTGNGAYLWNFGDGNNSTDENPTHTYTTSGTYTVSLLSINNCGSSTQTATVNIVLAPTALFTASPVSGCGPLVVQYNDQSTGGPTEWSWSFPGGTPSVSSSPNPEVTYDAPGIYAATLVVSNPAGQNTLSESNFITVDPNATASFSSTINGDVASFNNASTNATSYSWDFGDGTSSTDMNPVHTYNSDGDYTVVLTATNNCGSISFSETINITTVPTAAFSANTTSGCVPLSVQFTDQSSLSVTSWNWSFTGGTPSISTDQNPLIQYNQAGTYPVVLTVTNASGTNTVLQSDYIVVGDVPTANFTSTINGQSISFINNTANANNYSWDFGDGNMSTDFEPSHTYNSDGTYTVSMTATNDCGPTTVTETVVITTAPTAAFNSTATNGCAPLTVEFFNQSSANAVSWNWSFPGGNPSSSTLQNPTVIYNTSGTYNVMLEVSNSSGVTSIVEQSNYIVINDVPTANFTSSINGQSISFINNTANANNYSWDFGDGNMSTGFEPSHTYNSDGTYTVSMTATNDCGPTTVTETVVITTAPTAAFTTNVSSGCSPLSVTFQNQSSSNAIGWSWDFPGGEPSSSSEQNPTVLYNNAGTYTAILTVFNPQGTDMVTVTDVVVVNSVPSPDFSFVVNGPTVEFSNNSINGASYSWDFGDGNFSNEENPNYQYSLNGDYTVVLSVTNDCGTTTTNQTVSITSSVIAGFTSNLTAGCSPLEIQFNDQSINATAWEWNFAGGVPATSTEANPVVTYTNPGFYTVELTAINSSGNSTITETGYILVNSVPFLDFSIDVTGLTVDFNNMTLSADTYLWDFGDGATSADMNPQHTYADVGVYQATLIATNECGNSEVDFTVDVGTAVTAGFTSSNATIGCAPLEVQFMDNSEGFVTSWNWTFPGGSPASSIEQNPLITYNTPGTYEVVLEVGNGFNSNETIVSNYIVIENLPTPSFSADINLADVAFTNNSVDALSYSWSFGDGGTSTNPTPLYTYTTDGIYTVVLTATNDCGSITYEETVEIVTPVTASFESNTTSGCLPFEVQFLDLSSSNSTSWSWTFEGAFPATSTEQNPTVVYNEPGTYAVTLEVGNSQFTDTETITNYIIVEGPPVANFTEATSGMTTVFTNISNNANTYEWMFGDGSISNEENPIHTYADAGTYTVTLVVTNNCGSDTFTFEVTTTAAPTANFTTNVSSGCIPLIVQFTNGSSDNVTDWAWTFENGSPSTSSLENPEITFNTPGIHEVTLVVSNAAGTSTSTTQIVVEAPPMVAFSRAINSLTVDFTNQTTGATSYAWDFGDGNTSTDENPQHEYLQGGNYVVVLTATNNCGSTMVVETIEIVGPLTVAAFTQTTSGECAPVTVDFTDQSSNNPIAWNWTFEGGTPATSTEENPTVVYNVAGTYDVTLIASNFAGSNTISQSAIIVVEPLPVANFVPTVSAQGNISLLNTSTGALQYEWSFGDNNTSTEENPSYTYDTTGTYEVTLIVTNDCGTDTMTQEVSVLITADDDIISIEKFNLYPNPNDGQFILHLEGLPSDDLQMSLYNILGQRIHQEELDFSNGEIVKTYHFQNLAAATYILQLQSEGKMLYKKVVVE